MYTTSDMNVTFLASMLYLQDIWSPAVFQYPSLSTYVPILGIKNYIQAFAECSSWCTFSKKNQKLQFLIFQLVKYCNRYWVCLISNPSHCNIMSKNSSETVPDCFLSRPSLNISYCQSGPQPTLMTGEAAQGGQTDTHTHKCNHHQWQAMQTHTETQLLCC